MKHHLRVPLVADPKMSRPDYPVCIPKYSDILWDRTKCRCSIPSSEVPSRGMLKKIPWITIVVDDDCAACAAKIKDLLSRLDVTERNL